MSRKIAIVEDEAELASLLEYNLTRHGYRAQCSAGRGTRSRNWRTWKPDLIVLDVMLPEIDGFDLCRQIRAVGRAGPHPGAVPDRAVGRSGPRAGTGNRRRRLHDQAVQPARAGGAGQGAPAARRDGRRSPSVVESGPFRLDRTARRAVPERPGTGADLHRVQAAGILPDPPAAAHTAASSCSTRSGASSVTSRRARWMCTCGACASRSRSSPTTRGT